MKFKDLDHLAEWVEYSGQRDSGVTYIYMAPEPIARLRGESDILYIGETIGQIRNRFRQETATNNTPGVTQNTNIRTTHVFRQLELGGILAMCFYATRTLLSLSSEEEQKFSQRLRTWDKRAYIGMGDHFKPTLEKYLLTTYADQHLELPPLNNKF